MVICYSFFSFVRPSSSHNINSYICKNNIFIEATISSLTMIGMERCWAIQLGTVRIFHLFYGIMLYYGPLARYVKLRVAHAPGMPGTFLPRHRGLTIPTCITAHTWLAVSFEVGGGENVPGIPGACATRNFMYLVRGPWPLVVQWK